MNQPRHESEWLRELMHEYSHVALPPFAGFAPPLEPFGNGAVGETLGMLWAAGLWANGTADGTASPTGATGARTPLHPQFPRRPPRPLQWPHRPQRRLPPRYCPSCTSITARNALPSLQFWNERGPSSPLRSQGTPDALRFLQGLTVGIERVYGARVLSAALALASRQQRVAPLRAAALLTATETVLRDALGSGEHLSIWLPGALETAPPLSRTAAGLAARAPLRLQVGQRTQGWLYVPPTAGALRIEWQVPAPENQENNVSSGDEPSGASRLNPALRVEGNWKTVPDGGALPNDNLMPGAGRSAAGVLRVALSGQSGWQHFAFVAARDLVLGAARFERDVQPAINKSRP